MVQMVSRRSLYPLRSSFFGLTQEYRYNLFKTIHEIVFFGNGGYDWFTVYDMPIWLRKATFNFINESIKRQSDAEQEAINKTQSKGSPNVTNFDWAKPDKNKLK